MPAPLEHRWRTMRTAAGCKRSAHGLGLCSLGSSCKQRNNRQRTRVSGLDCTADRTRGPRSSHPPACLHSSMPVHSPLDRGNRTAAPSSQHRCPHGSIGAIAAREARKTTCRHCPASVSLSPSLLFVVSSRGSLSMKQFQWSVFFLFFLLLSDRRRPWPAIPVSSLRR